jgi:hypothetical protein
MTWPTAIERCGLSRGELGADPPGCHSWADESSYVAASRRARGR